MRPGPDGFGRSFCARGVGVACARLCRVSSASHFIKWDALLAVETHDFRDSNNGFKVHDGGATAAKAFVCFCLLELRISPPACEDILAVMSAARPGAVDLDHIAQDFSWS